MGDQETELIEARINIATLKMEVAHLNARMTELQASQASQEAKLDAVLAKISEARGGWRALMLIGGASATVGGGIGWLLTHLPKG